MTFYADLAALADELLVEFGFDATVRGLPTPSDPVTGVGGSDGASRTVRAVLASIDSRVFPDTLVQNGDQMMIFGGVVNVGEFVEGKGAVAEIQLVQPDDATHLITKALIRG